MLNEAIIFAKECHKGQFRSTGESYFNHPRNVAMNVFMYKESSKIEELMTASMLHDVVEDCNVSIEFIRDKFGDLVANLVKELTSDKKKRAKFNSKAEYLYDKMSNMTDYALVIKLADRLDNISELQNCSASFRNKYINETKYIIKNLKKNRGNMSNTHHRLINKIESTLKKYK